QGASFGNVVARDVMVEFTGPQSFDVIVTYNAINGVIPFDVSYSVALPSKGVPPYKLSVNKTGFGLLPVPSALISPLVSSATKALKKSKLTVLLSRIKWGKIEDGKLTVYSQINI
ncbi:MAG: hypothetical protein KAG98_03515, partial [Lentisphaeria bacterium]|nr:hypothetical protein [Lentisphaeria bacterium]